MKIKKLLFILVMVCSLSACKEEKPMIATSVYPVEYLAKRIAGDEVDVKNISQNTIIQRAKIRKNYKSILKQAEALFYIGGLEPYMELYIESIRKIDTTLYNLATKSAIYKFERYTSRSINGVETGLRSAYYESDEFENVDMYKVDPMLWMDPVAMTSMASDIRDELVDRHPEYQSIFNENYDALELDLARLDADFQEVAKTYQEIAFVSMTPSFGVWQKSYHVNIYPIILSKYGALPTKNQLEVMKARIKNDNVRYIAMEDNLTKDMVTLRDSLIDDLGLIPISLNNLSSQPKEKDENDYLSMMYANLQTLESIGN